MTLPEVRPHPLKSVFRKRNVRLWQLKKLLDNDVSEWRLSRTLSGIDTMPVDLEIKLENIASQLNA